MICAFAGMCILGRWGLGKELGRGRGGGEAEESVSDLYNFLG